MRRLCLLASLFLTACATGTPTAAPHHDVVFLAGVGYPGNFLYSVDAARGRDLAWMPLGAVAPDLRREYVANFAKQQLQTIDLASGRVVGSAPLGGDYHLSVDGNGMLAGLSANGRWLVLTGPDFRVIDTTGATPPRRLAFEGRMDFDAISDDGRWLYAIQWLDKRYSVRAYDVAAGTLEPGVVAAKGEPPVMSGVRGQSVFSSDHAWQFTVYTGGPTGAFVHALNLREPVAWCVFLPPAPPNAAHGWSLATAGTALYAANPLVRVAVAIDADPVNQWEEPQIVKTGHLPSAQANTNALVTGAEAKEFGGALAVSRDGGTLYVADGRWVQVVDTASMAVRTRWDAGAFTRPALSPSGDVVYWVDPNGDLIGIDTHTGRLRSHAKLDFSALTILGVR